MKQVCLYCNRTAVDSNMWCQEKDCPAEKSPSVLSYGEQLGDMEIVKFIATLRTSSLYEARRMNRKGKYDNILLKIAHTGYQERLKREALFLLELQAQQKPKQLSPLFPRLLAPHSQDTLSPDQYYGKTVFRGRDKYYTVFDHIEGDLLQNILLKNPQLWYKHVGWIMTSLTEALAVMHLNNRYHFCLSPESVLVRFDRYNYARTVLIDLGLVCDEQSHRLNWNKYHAQPAYTAPELAQGRPIGQGQGARTDIYGLGIILHELLAGEPAYAYHFRTAADVYGAVADPQRLPLPVKRDDLSALPKVTQDCLQKDPRRRPGTAVEFAAHFHFLSPIPKEKKPSPSERWLHIAMVAGVLVAIFLLIILALILTQRI